MMAESPGFTLLNMPIAGARYEPTMAMAKRTPKTSMASWVLVLFPELFVSGVRF